MHEPLENVELAIEFYLKLKDASRISPQNRVVFNSVCSYLERVFDGKEGSPDAEEQQTPPVDG